MAAMPAMSGVTTENRIIAALVLAMGLGHFVAGAIDAASSRTPALGRST